MPPPKRGNRAVPTTQPVTRVVDVVRTMPLVICVADAVRMMHLVMCASAVGATMRRVMCVKAVVRMMRRDMCARVVGQTMRRVMRVAAGVPTTHQATHVVVAGPMIRPHRPPSPWTTVVAVVAVDRAVDAAVAVTTTAELMSKVAAQRRLNCFCAASFDNIMFDDGV